MYPNIQFILDDEIEQLSCVALELLACVDIIEECWTQDLDVLSGESGDG